MVTVINKIIKIEPDLLVQPWTKPSSGPSDTINQLAIEPENRT